MASSDRPMRIHPGQVVVSRHVDLVSVLGTQVAKRVEPFGDGRRYVRAGQWAWFLAWLVDFVVVPAGLAPIKGDGLVECGH